jgi:hypothetical protein
MIDYNDGKWHGWNGGECPVHPESVVDGVRHSPMTSYTSYTAGLMDWDFCGAFKVRTPYVEQPKPREFWLTGHVSHESRAAADAFLSKVRADNPGLNFASHEPIRVREVLE